MQNKTEFLPGLTTTAGDWEKKLEEICRFGIKEIALFPTVLLPKERQELYNALAESTVRTIPHVHLRDDMEKEELDMFAKKYNCRLFNVHDNERAEKLLEFEEYAPMIYVENRYAMSDYYREFLKRCAGICLDISHLEDFGVLQKYPQYTGFEDLLKSHKIGCCHISAVSREPRRDEKHIFYSRHRMDDHRQLDYLAKYKQYLPEYASMELENPIEEQLEAIEYIKKDIL